MKPAGSRRRPAKELAVRYTIVRSPLGKVLVAATSKGICWLGLGDSERSLLRELRSDLPEALIAPDAGGMRRWARSIREFFLRGGQARVTMDLAGTPFQRAVWRELRRIAPGRTCSYAEIARRIGRPYASRAVGAAVGANPVSLFIPCHRAVGSDGSLTGYRWGLARKRKLLAHEAAAGR
jgi:AraC family transcriptional regulator of adaptative response/methylated-DNA-[protein]-cysteine methyltransferase